MSKSRHATTAPMIMAIVAAAIIAGLTVLPRGVFSVPEARATPRAEFVVDPARSIDEAPPSPLKGGACSLLEWPNYEESCQFDVRSRAAEKPTVRIIAVR